MKTVVVSFGDGRHAEYAKVALRRFEQLNEVESWMLNIEALPRGLSHPTWAKAWIWESVPSDVERVIWIDTDVIPIRPIMDLIPDFAIPWCAVEDIEISRQEAEWDKERVEGVRTYFNAGVFVAHRSTEPMFRRLQEIALLGKRYQFSDQTPMNLLVDEMFGEEEFVKLPRECNWLLPFGDIPADVRMVHLAGAPFRDTIIRLFGLLESSPAQGSRIERGASCVESW